MQMSNSLMRYHSAPSSVLASLLDEDSAQPRVSDAFLQVEESEFARFLDDHLCTMVDPQPGSKPLSSPDFHSIPASTIEEAGACLTDSEMRPPSYTEHESSAPLQKPPCMATAGCSNSINEIFGFRGPLSSISEVLADESNKVCRLDDAQTMKISSASQWPKPPKTPAISQEAGLAHVKGQLARHNSSPADVLSRLIMVERSTGESVLHFGDPSTQESGEGRSMLQLNHVCATFALPAERISTFDQVNCASNTEDGKRVFVVAKSVKSPADERKSSLLRQNSSPADLLSQISFGGMSSLACTEMASSPFSKNATEEGRRGGAYQPARCWGEIGFEYKAGLEDRKRGRVDDHGLHRLQSSEISFTNEKYPHVGRSYDKMCGSKGLVKMEVLCRVSAKRGCATHPRSIAERVRRTKINEGIRKLQELMPNMEKQTNTVTMLDEALEYVKFLQQQVQELSESRSKCDGRCNPKANA